GTEQVLGIPTASYEPAVCFGATNYLAVWRSRPGMGNFHDIVGARLSATAQPLEAATPVSLSANPQRQPVAAADGTNYLLVWSDGRRGDGKWDIVGSRITPFGEALDPGGLAIT